MILWVAFSFYDIIFIEAWWIHNMSHGIHFSTNALMLGLLNSLLSWIIIWWWIAFVHSNGRSMLASMPISITNVEIQSLYMNWSLAYDVAHTILGCFNIIFSRSTLGDEHVVPWIYQSTHSIHPFLVHSLVCIGNQ